MHAPLDCDHIEAKNVCAMKPELENRSCMDIAATAGYLGESRVKPLKPYITGQTGRVRPLDLMTG